MTDALRLFVALPLPDEVRHELSSLAAPIDGARWLDFDQLHLTLVFLGTVTLQRLAALDLALERVRQPPFELRLTGAGHFPGRGRPRVLWAGVRAPEALVSLHGALIRRLRAAGFELERRRFRPHVTLARLRGADPGEVARRLDALGPWRGRAWTAGAFELWRSDLRPEGARYEVLRRYRLVDPGSEPVEVRR